MHALLFDRKSLLLTAAALAGIGVTLFLAGFVLGVTVTRNRELVPPRWVEYGPPLPDDPRAIELPPPAADEPASDRERGEEAAATGGRESEEWVPFARPGEVEALLETEIGLAELEEGRREGAPSEAASLGEGAAPVRAPEPAPPAIEAADPTPAAGSWYVQTGAFSVAGYAHAAERELESRFAGAAYGPYLREITDRRGRRLLTVRLGPFPTRAAADAVAAEFEDVLVRREGSSL